MKGIILAGGAGTRLYPSTLSVSKQMLPIYDKPMIYYPISTLMLAGIREILIISTMRDLSQFKELLGNGEQYGLNFSYSVQQHPRGLADAFLVGEKFIGKDRVCLVLGDNVFYGRGFTTLLETVAKQTEAATIFGYHVNNPSEFGVVDFDEHGNVLSIKEKPKTPKSNYVVPGLYFYDNQVIQIAKTVQPSPRGEIEITSVNNAYLQMGKLKVELFGRGIAWLDTGSHSSLLNASVFVETIQSRQGLYVSCLEEIAYRRGYITKEILLTQADKLRASDYGQYLYQIANGSR